MRRVLADTSAYSAFLRGHAGVGSALREADEIRVTPDLRRFLASPRVGVVGIDEETAEAYATIVTFLRTSGAMLPTNDLWIAASAMQHGLAVLTTDADFLRIPQILVDHHPVG